MTLSRYFLRLGSFGAAISALLLVSMAFTTQPAGMEYPGLAVLTGQRILSITELDTYLGGIRLLFVLDGFFLAGWILAWLGIGELIRTRQPLLGLLTLFFGLLGALFDFSENSLILGALQIFQFGQVMTPSWVIAWKAIQHLSYWLPFLAAALAAPALWQGGRLEKALALTGSILLLPAVIGLYFPNLSMLPNLWFFVWFTLSALSLWQSAGKNPSCLN